MARATYYSRDTYSYVPSYPGTTCIDPGRVLASNIIVMSVLDLVQYYEFSIDSTVSRIRNYPDSGGGSRCSLLRLRALAARCGSDDYAVVLTPIAGDPRTRDIVTGRWGRLPCGRGFVPTEQTISWYTLLPTQIWLIQKLHWVKACPRGPDLRKSSCLHMQFQRSTSRC